jgi:hypothetical protein
MGEAKGYAVKAITLRHPWAWCICCASKRVENRTWSPSMRIGEKFAIHGGRWPIGADDCAHGAKDQEYVEEIEDAISDLKAEKLLPPGGITLRMLSRYAGIVAVATFGGAVTASESPWFCGPFGWVMTDVLVLPEPVPCRGAHGLWDVPADVLVKMRAQFIANAPALPDHRGE